MLVPPFPFRRAGAATHRITIHPLMPASVVVAAAFALAPWPLEQKAHAVLHGLCTQRPSHSLLFDGRALPFDARMTGIYAGFLIASLYLLARGRIRAQQLPSIPVMAMGAFFVGAMAIDGANSFLVDAGIGPLYQPANWLRLLTGLLTGTVLAPIVVYLLATTLWRPARDRVSVLQSGGELVLMALLTGPLALLLLAGASWLFVPMTVLLIVAALLMVTAIMLVAVVLVRHGDGAFSDPDQVRWPSVAAFVLALVLLAILGSGRFLLERLADAPALT
jgi:uncharacterized membrane protein